ncbi:hypothetical protein GCM10027589_30420 [Actinocorallia lasiicapitis]
MIEQIAAPKARADSRLHRILSTGAGILLLAGAVAVWRTGPQIEATTTDPIRTDGVLGAEITTDAFKVKAIQVTTGRTAKDSLGTTLTSAEGVYVTVRIAGQGVGEPWRISAMLESGGKRYRSDSGLVTAFEPELWRTEDLVFEVPPERVKGAHLVVGISSMLLQLTPEADIDLKVE